MQCQSHRETRCCSFSCSTVPTPWLYSISTVMNMLNILLVQSASTKVWTQIGVHLVQKFQKLFLALKFLVQKPLIFTGDDGLWGALENGHYIIVLVPLLVQPLMML